MSLRTLHGTGQEPIAGCDSRTALQCGAEKRRPAWVIRSKVTRVVMAKVLVKPVREE